MLPSPRNSRTGLHPHTGPQITTTPRPRTASPSSPLNRPSLQTSAVARPRPNPHSKRPGTAQYVPSLAVSSLGGFQTPAAVGVGMYVCHGRRLETFTIGRPCDYDGGTSGVTQVADDMLRRPSRQRWATGLNRSGGRVLRGLLGRGPNVANGSVVP